jgi:RNA polymerase sigma-70 factor (ECF subfamily)
MPLPTCPQATPESSRRWLDDPDVRLMLRARDGDGDAFAELTGRYGPRVLGYFCKQVRDRAEAEDLTQEVFLRLYRARARYQPKARFATWVFRVMQNVARNARRSRLRRPWVCFDLSDEGALPEALRADDGEAPWRSLERDEMAGVVRAAVAGLAGRSQAAVELQQFQGRSCAEIAAALGITAKAVKCLLFRARNQLRAALTPLVEEGAPPSRS